MSAGSSEIALAAIANWEAVTAGIDRHFTPDRRAAATFYEVWLMDYWRECVTEALSEAGIDATDEQLVTVTEIVAGGHETIGMHTGPPPEATVDPRDQQIRDLKDELETHSPIGRCLACAGKDLIDVHACSACNGAGYIYGVSRRNTL